MNETLTLPPLPKASSALPSGCSFCGKNASFASHLCPTCRAVEYCSRSHRRLHRKVHRIICVSIKNAKSDNQLPAIQIYHALPWGSLSFLVDREQPGLPNLLARIHTVASVKAQLAHLEGLNNYSLDPSRIPLLMRLDRDMEAYHGIKSIQAWQTMNEGTQSLKNSNAFEPVKFCDIYNLDVETVLSLTLLKVKILLDLRRMKLAIPAIGPKLPRELFDMILAQVPKSPIVLSALDIIFTQDLSEIITEMEGQVDELYNRVHNQNPYIWNCLTAHEANDLVIERAENLDEKIDLQLRLAKTMFLRHIYAWFETPGAIDVLREKAQSRVELVDVSSGTGPDASLSGEEVAQNTSKLGLANLLARVHTIDSVRAQLKHAECLPGDDIQASTLPLLARLNQDQRMYDRIKSLTSVQGTGISYENSNPFEPVKACSFLYNSVEVMLSLTLLKVKLLLDLMRRNAALAIAGRKLPEELLQRVLDNIPPSPIIQANKAIMSAADLSPMIKEMENQVEHLYVMIGIMDPLIWEFMVLHEPDNPIIDHIPGNFETSLFNHVRYSKDLFLRHVYAWVEIPGAMAVIQEKFRSRPSENWLGKLGCCVY